MIKKLTHLGVVDNCGVKLAKCIHHYFGFYKQTSHTGHFLKVSVRKRNYAFIWVKSKLIYTLKKGKRSKAYVIRTKYKCPKIDGSALYSLKNMCVLLKKRLTSRGKFAFGPFSYGHGRRKILGSFVGLV